MSTREELHKVVEKLNDEQLSKVIAVVEALLEQDDPRERWRRIPGVRVPGNWPPDYGDVDPVRVEGEPVSEQLIRERR